MDVFVHKYAKLQFEYRVEQVICSLVPILLQVFSIQSQVKNPQPIQKNVTHRSEKSKSGSFLLRNVGAGKEISKDT